MLVGVIMNSKNACVEVLEYIGIYGWKKYVGGPKGGHEAGGAP